MSNDYTFKTEASGNGFESRPHQNLVQYSSIAPSSIGYDDPHPTSPYYNSVLKRPTTLCSTGQEYLKHKTETSYFDFDSTIVISSSSPRSDSSENNCSSESSVSSISNRSSINQSAISSDSILKLRRQQDDNTQGYDSDESSTSHGSFQSKTDAESHVIKEPNASSNSTGRCRRCKCGKKVQNFSNKIRLMSREIHNLETKLMKKNEMIKDLTYKNNALIEKQSKAFINVKDGRSLKPKIQSMSRELHNLEATLAKKKNTIKKLSKVKAELIERQIKDRTKIIRQNVQLKSLKKDLQTMIEQLKQQRNWILQQDKKFDKMSDHQIESTLTK